MMASRPSRRSLLRLEVAVFALWSAFLVIFPMDAVFRAEFHSFFHLFLVSANRLGLLFEGTGAFLDLEVQFRFEFANCGHGLLEQLGIADIQPGGAREETDRTGC